MKDIQYSKMVFLQNFKVLLCGLLVTIACAQPVEQSQTHPLDLVYPWRKYITATVFWIGELPAGANKTPNDKSSWDSLWMQNYGGYDNPDPVARSGFIPRAFTPQLNPFYVALPYNDVQKGGSHKAEAKWVIPWFQALRPKRGRSVCKGRWIQILHDGKSCFAQWEDCGPWTTEDADYVFLGHRPQNTRNKGAGIDVSPAVRDFLDLQSGEKCHWRFVPFNRIPQGPWSRYGKNNAFLYPSTLLRSRVRR